MYILSRVMWPYVLVVQCSMCSVYLLCLQSSRNLLLELSRQLLSGEGDVTRHLGYIGYSVTYEQVLSYVLMQCVSL